MICTVTLAVASDRAQKRYSFILIACVVGALGFIALIATPRPGLPGLTYGFLFLASSGIYACIIPTICWIGRLPIQRNAVRECLPSV